MLVWIVGDEFYLRKGCVLGCLFYGIMQILPQHVLCVVIVMVSLELGPLRDSIVIASFEHELIRSNVVKLYCNSTL